MKPWPDGLVVVDKPADWTSHDVVAKTRRLAGTRKVGHAGTLDPMATGVLVLGIGRGTKLLTFLVGCDKDYTATVRLGQATVTDDAEGEVTAQPGVAGVSEAAVHAAADQLTGDIEQVPSAVSAIKVDGVRSYHRARSGESVELAARPVRVSRFEVGPLRPVLSESGTDLIDVDVEVTVSSGTYVRALARDLGAALDSAGHLTALRRTRVGGFTVDDAHRLDDLIRADDLSRVDEVARADDVSARQPEAVAAPAPVIDLAAAARAALPARELTAEQARAIGFGQRVDSAEPGRGEPVAAFGPDGALVAVLDESRPVARSHVVFAPQSS